MDVVIAKKTSLERCISQARAYYKLPSELPFAEDYLRQDAISANIQRACELAIDIANVVIKLRRLGVPQSSRESFEILAREGVISPELAAKMKNMVGFRNIMVHQYKDLDAEVYVEVIEAGADQLLEFAQAALLLAQSQS
ncbi:MAG: type VII toxin-antitoxin system HepT family RNase toxin [Fimbriimonas sp.]